MNFDIVNMDRAMPSGMVQTLHWTCSKQDGEYSASVYGSIGVPEKSPSDQDFINFDDITKEIAVAWLVAAMGAEQVAAHEAAVAAQIAAQKAPVSASGLPW